MVMLIIGQAASAQDQLDGSASATVAIQADGGDGGQRERISKLQMQLVAERSGILRDTDTLIRVQTSLGMDELMRRSRLLFARKQRLQIACARLTEEIRLAPSGHYEPCVKLPD
jgi:hypothetical protein